MKKTIHYIAIFIVLFFTRLEANAQTTPKILTVDLIRIFDGHYKTKEQLAKFQADAAKAKDQFDQIAKEGNALVEQYKELDDQSKNPTSTADAKAKAQADAQKKLDEIRQKQSEQQSFGQSARNSIQQREQTFKTLLIEEITKVAVEVAKRKGATLLIDKSGPTMVGVSNILYSEPSLDITDDVLAEINKDRPAITPTPYTSSTASPVDDRPKITLPGNGPNK